MEVLRLEAAQTREHAVTSVTVPKMFKKPSKYKGLSGNASGVTVKIKVLPFVTTRRVI